MKKTIMVIISLCVGMVTSSAWAKKIEATPKGVEQSRVLDKSPAAKANFGKTVSKEAKSFQTDPVPGHRNFGQWVSCQRSQSRKHCAILTPPSATLPNGTPPAVKPADPMTPPDSTGDPTASTSDGSNGT